ncbi:hypothetical protein E4U21_003178 [Claviceps maximensis]|nr:hypothetical protein E4U21_003178 [Claviceps maximensis]
MSQMSISRSTKDSEYSEYNEVHLSLPLVFNVQYDYNYNRAFLETRLCGERSITVN